MSSPSATSLAPLAGATGRHVTITRWSFASADAARRALNAFRRAAPPSNRRLESVAFLLGAASPRDAGILRGTTASDPSEPACPALVVGHWDGAPDVDGVWTPPGGRLRPGPTRFSHHRDVRFDSDRRPDEWRATVDFGGIRRNTVARFTEGAWWRPDRGGGACRG